MVGISNEVPGSRSSEPEVADWYKRSTEMELEWEPRWLERTTTNLALWEALAPCSHYAHSPHPRTMTPLPSGFQLFFTNPEIEGLVVNLTKNELFL